MWTLEEAQQIIAIAREVVPDLRTMSIPKGLQADKGPNAVVEHVKARLPELLGQ